MSNRDKTNSTEEAAIALCNYEGDRWLNLSELDADTYRARARVCIAAALKASELRDAEGTA